MKKHSVFFLLLSMVSSIYTADHAPINASCLPLTTDTLCGSLKTVDNAAYFFGEKEFIPENDSQKAIHLALNAPQDEQNALARTIVEKAIVNTPLGIKELPYNVKDLAIGPNGNVVALFVNPFFSHFIVEKSGKIKTNLDNQWVCEMPMWPGALIKALSRTDYVVQSKIEFSKDGACSRISVKDNTSTTGECIGHSWDLAHKFSEYRFFKSSWAMEKALKEKPSYQYDNTANITENGIELRSNDSEATFRTLLAPENTQFKKCFVGPSDSKLIVAYGTDSEKAKLFFYPFAQHSSTETSTTKTTLPQAVALVLYAQIAREEMSCADRIRFFAPLGKYAQIRKHAQAALKSIPTDHMLFALANSFLEQ